MATDLWGDLLGAKAPVVGVRLALLVAPLAWATALLGNYVATAHACDETLTLLPFLSLAMIAIVVGFLGYAWATRRRAERSVNGQVNVLREHMFTVNMALLSCALFATAIAAQALPPWLLHDCH